MESYWTKRRKLNARVQKHIQFITEFDKAKARVISKDEVQISSEKEHILIPSTVYANSSEFESFSKLADERMVQNLIDRVSLNNSECNFNPRENDCANNSVDKADTYERALYKQRKNETSDLQTTASEEKTKKEYRLSKRKRKSTLRFIENEDMPESPSPPPVPNMSGSMDPPPSPPVHYPQKPLPVPPPVTPVQSSPLLPVLPPVTPLQSMQNHTGSSYSEQVGRPPSALTENYITIIKMLEEIKSELAMLHTKVDRIIVNQGQGQNHQDPIITEEVALPISSVDKLQELEGHLSEVAYENYLVSSLGVIGGSSLQDTVRRIMKRVLHHDVAVATNWTGKGGKTQFGTLKLSNVIIKAVRMNHKCAQSTHEDVERGIKEWFRGAPDRNGGRLKRQISKQISSMTND